MADGCNLYATRADLKQIATSLKRPDLAAQPTPTDVEAGDVRQVLERIPRERIVELLENRSTPAGRAMSRMVVSATGADKNVTPEDTRRIPEAFRIVLKDHPSSLGVFLSAPGPRGRGCCGIQHGGEILAAASLKQREYTTSTGESLTIRPNDELHFGQKHGGEFVERKKGKGSIESDLLVEKHHARSGKDRIGIDVKYSMSGKYGAKPETQEQLERARNILNDGQVHRHVFATQGIFKEDFRKLVTATNRKLAVDWLVEHTEDLESLQPLTTPRSSSTESQAAHAISALGGKNFDKFVRDHKVPVIETCERIRPIQ